MKSPASFIIAFSNSSLKKGECCPLHSHKGVELVFHPSGKGESLDENGESVSFEEGDVVVYPPGSLHKQRMTENGTDNCVQISVDEEGFIPAFEKPLKLSLVRSRTALAELSELSCWNDEEPKEAKDFRAAALLLTLLKEATRLDAQPEPSLVLASEARRIALAELREPPSAAEIAKRVGVSPDHLRHLMLKHFGQGLKEISLDARIARAMSLLRNSPLTTKEVAAECGFANERAFWAAFKARTGRPPGEFRTLEEEA